MSYISVQEAAQKWGVSDRMVRRYCNENLIPGLLREGKLWLIPATAPKPSLTAVVKSEDPLPSLAKKLNSQQKKRNFHGLYDYTILNLTYSSCRMASCRLTRTQVEYILKTGKAHPSFEAAKVSDLIEVRNHCDCVDYILQNVLQTLTPRYIKQLHRMLMSGTVDEQFNKVTAGEFRKNDKLPKGRALPVAKSINGMLMQLTTEYEGRKEVLLKDILGFHVQLERIAPFEDGNGRVGRLIMFKECLRHGVVPFILDDKRRSRYYQGIRQWDDEPEILMEVVFEAQQRYGAQIELQKLLASDYRNTTIARRGRK